MGYGKQKIGAAMNLGAFYLAGILMAVMLAFVFHLNGMVPFLFNLSLVNLQIDSLKL